MSKKKINWRKKEHLRSCIQGAFGSSHTILDGCLVDDIYYAAVRIEKTGEVWAYIAHVYDEDNRWGFGRRDWDETEGPIQKDCPAKILKLLTPTSNRNAIEWRKECLERSKTPLRRRLEEAVQAIINEAFRDITPFDVPVPYKKIISAGFRNNKNKVVATLEMFDGMTAVVEVGRWITSVRASWIIKWYSITDGNFYWIGDKWQRVQTREQTELFDF